MRRKRTVAIAAFVLAFWVGFVGLVDWLGPPKVRLQNDLSFDVGVRGCKEWRRIGTQSQRSLVVVRPCEVYRLEGNLETYVGCLRLAEDAFDGQVTFVSTYDPDITKTMCINVERYGGHGRAARAWSRLRDFLGL